MRMEAHLPGGKFELLDLDMGERNQIRSDFAILCERLAGQGS